MDIWVKGSRGSTVYVHGAVRMPLSQCFGIKVLDFRLDGLNGLSGADWAHMWLWVRNNRPAKFFTTVPTPELRREKSRFTTKQAHKEFHRTEARPAKKKDKGETMYRWGVL